MTCDGRCTPGGGGEGFGWPNMRFYHSPDEGTGRRLRLDEAGSPNSAVIFTAPGLTTCDSRPASLIALSADEGIAVGVPCDRQGSGLIGPRMCYRQSAGPAACFKVA